MPTIVITEEQWQKLKRIFLDLNIYDKPSLKRLIKNADMEWVSIDVTYIGAYQSSIGAVGTVLYSFGVI